MKKIVLMAISLFLVVSSCKKDDTTTDTEDPTTPVVIDDAATTIAGTYTGTGSGLVAGSTTPFSCTQVKITRVTATSVSITSPEGKFSAITMTGLIEDADGDVYNNGSTSDIDYDGSIKEVDITHAATTGSLIFDGIK